MTWNRIEKQAPQCRHYLWADDDDALTTLDVALQAEVENGVLADVAPSILHILGMPQPADMTGRDLIK